MANKTIVTPALVSALFTGWNGDFQKGLTGAPSQYTKIATVVPSTSKSNTYGWLGKAPRMKKWLTERQIEQMKAHGYQIINESFESTVGVDRDDIEDDQVGIYAPLFEELGFGAAEQPDEMVFEALRNGFIKKCYDGQNFFDADHPLYEKVDGTGEVTSVSNVTIDDSYQGESWYLLDCTRPLRPIIFQNRKSPELVRLDQTTDYLNFMSKQLVYGVDTRCATGYGFWQMAHGFKAELTASNLWKGVKAMRQVKTDGGRRLGIRPNILVVPPSLEDVAVKLLERELSAENNTTVANELKGRFEIVVGDYL